MKSKGKITGHLAVILRKMCSTVGAKFEDIDFSKDGWYTKHTWSKEDEGAFAKWLYKYLGDRTVWRGLYGLGPNTARVRKNAVTWFLASYGWSIRSGEK